MYAISVLRELEALTALEPAVELVGTLSDQTETRHGIFLKGSGSASSRVVRIFAIVHVRTVPLSNYIIDVIKNIAEGGKIAFSLAF